MAHVRRCSKLLLGLCGRFLVRQGNCSGSASKSLLRLRVHEGSFCARACVCASVCLCGCEYVYMHVCMCICMRACIHLHMVQKCATVNSLTPRCGGDPIRAQKWSRCDLLCVRFWFVFEQEANRRKLLRCGNHQPGNQKWQEHLRVRASTLCARVSVHLCVHTWLLHQQCLTVVKQSRPHIRSSHINCINTTTTQQQQQHPK